MKKNWKLETDRLYLQELVESDYKSLCYILQDKDVMYAYEHAFSDEEVNKWLLNQQQRYDKIGVGLWAVVLKENDEMIGQCGLTLQDYNEVQVYEIGYLFQKKYWHQGYAIESSLACKKYAFDVLKIKEVYSIIRDSNFASQKVAKKMGMKVCDEFTKHYYDKEMLHYVFKVKNEKKNEERK